MFVEKTVYKVGVDYDQTLEQMIAAGKYDWTHFDIDSKFFPIMGDGRGEVKLRIIYFNDNMVTISEAARHIQESGLQMAKIEHLLAFGAQYPHMQCERRIKAPSATYQESDDFYRVPVLDWGGEKWARHLSVYRLPVDYRWGEPSCFLAVEPN